MHFFPHTNHTVFTQTTYDESLKCAITMLFLFTVLGVHVCGCVCVWACVCVCFCSFMFGPYCYWLDCSHPPIHPIATIATDGAAGINAPGSASLINGRSIKPLISDLSLVTFDPSYLLHSQTASSYRGCSSFAFLSVVLYLFRIHAISACHYYL